MSDLRVLLNAIADRDRTIATLRGRLDALEVELERARGQRDEARQQVEALRAALERITETPYRDWHLNARIARAALAATKDGAE